MRPFALVLYASLAASFVSLGVMKVRARRERKTIENHLASEVDATAAGPLARLFEEHGAPPPLGALLAAPPGLPKANTSASEDSGNVVPIRSREPAATGRGLFSGVSMPCDLVPLTWAAVGAKTPVMPDRTVCFATTGFPADILRENLDDTFRDAGLDMAWDEEGLVGRLARGDEFATLAIHGAPDTVLDAAGKRRFPTAPEGGVVVEVTLL